MNLPNKITISRIVLTVVLMTTLIILDYIPGFTPIMLGEVNLVHLIALVVFLIASLTDWVDGFLARRWHQVTDLGKFLDPIADKLLVNSFLIYFCVSHFGLNSVTIPIFCVILMIARDLVVDALRFVAASKGMVVAANIFGKMKTVFQMVALPFFFLNDWPFYFFDANWGGARICYILIYITTAMSVISGCIYVYQNRAVLKESKKNG